MTRYVVLPRGLVTSTSELRAVGVLLVMLLLVGFGLVKAYGPTHDDLPESARAKALDTARRQVLALTTVGTSEKGSDTDRLLSGATPEFRAEYSSKARAMKKGLTKARVTSTGTIVSAGLASVTGTRAEALVVATSAVRNAQGQVGATRRYRLRVALTVKDSRWLVSGLKVL